jgi:beta-D-xylosidase 4
MKLVSPSTWILAAALAARSGLAFRYPDCLNGPLANNAVCDVKASPSDRAAALVKAMNVTEKLANLVEYVTR